MDFMDALPWILVASLLVAVLSMRKSASVLVAAPARALTADEATRVRARLRSGGRIDAIREHREITGAGLRDARDAVDAMHRE